MQITQKQKINISNTAKMLMIQDAIQTFPNECCGFFYGYEKEGIRYIELAQVTVNNKLGDQRRRFEISPLAYMQAERFAEENGLTLLGIYHSHPNHPAIPSVHDFNKALPYFSYIIIAVKAKKFERLRSWRLNETNSAFEEEQIV